MSYPGIDYGLGQSNIDKSTGIHYGVISQHSVNPDALDDLEPDYGPPTCPKCGGEVKASDEVPSEVSDAEWFNVNADYACSKCEECFWSEDCFPEESQGFSYSTDGYELADCLDSDIFVLRSPYYTFAQFCSPCVPGAGNLDTFVSEEDGGVKCYALGHEWFDAENPCPYPVYSVKTGALVLPEEV